MKKVWFLFHCGLNVRGRVGLWVLGILYLCALAAGFVAPYSYDQEFRKLSYHPPSRVHFFDGEGRFHWRPFVYVTKMEMKRGVKTYQEVKEQSYPLRFFLRGSSYRFLGILRTNVHLFGTDDAAPIYLLGSDWNGRDMFSRIVYGSRISLSVGLVAILISTFLGLLVGGISGFVGGACDRVVMRLLEILMSFPSFFLMLSLRAVFPLEMSSVQVYGLIICIMAFLGWPGLARIVRGMVLSLREREFVTAAEALGAGPLRIVFLHIIPHTTSFVIVSATLAIPGYILGESALSLLGLGITEPQASWGNMLSRAMSITTMVNYPWILVPGIAIFVTIMAFNLVGDALRDKWDVRGY